jgi:hypothetical protein
MNPRASGVALDVAFEFVAAAFRRASLPLPLNLHLLLNL